MFNPNRENWQQRDVQLINELLESDRERLGLEKRSLGGFKEIFFKLLLFFPHQLEQTTAQMWTGPASIKKTLFSPKNKCIKCCQSQNIGENISIEDLFYL